MFYKINAKTAVTSDENESNFEGFTMKKRKRK